jgi:hypothetical protein
LIGRRGHIVKGHVGPILEQTQLGGVTPLLSTNQSKNELSLAVVGFHQLPQIGWMTAPSSPPISLKMAAVLLSISYHSVTAAAWMDDSPNLLQSILK